MSANRFAWIGVGVVVVVVGGLVVRSLKTDNTIQTASTSQEQTSGPSDANGGDRAPSKSDVKSDGSGSSTGSEATGGAPRKISSIEEARRVLKTKGFYDGPMNADYDANLAESLKKFQASVGMRPTGYLDMPTYKALGVNLRTGKRKQ